MSKYIVEEDLEKKLVSAENQLSAPPQLFNYEYTSSPEARMSMEMDKKISYEPVHGSVSSPAMQDYMSLPQ